MPLQSMSAVCNHCQRPSNTHLSQQLISTERGRLHTACAAALQVREPRQRLFLQNRHQMTAPVESGFLLSQIQLEKQKLVRHHLHPWINRANSATDRDARLKLMARMLKMNPKLHDKTLVLTGPLELIGTQSLSALPCHLHIKGSLELVGCNQLESMPDHLKIDGHLEINGCTSLQKLSKNTEVAKELSILSCPQIITIPNMHMKGDIDIMDCQRLTSLESGFHARKKLSLSDNPVLTHLPDNIRVDGDCNLEDSHSLTHLPAHAQIGGDLILAGCQNITRIPEWVLSLGAINTTQNTTRLVDLSGTGLPRQTIAQLHQIETPGMQLIFGQGDLTQKKFVAVETKPGFEAQDLLSVLTVNPKQALFIQYTESPGIDQGGLSHQAFESAYHCFLKPETGLFIKHTNEFQIKPSSNPKVQQKQLQNAHHFGLILGRIHGLSMAVGQSFSDEFYQKLHNAYLQIHSLSFNLNSLQKLGNLPNTLTAREACQILNALDPLTYTSAVLKPMDQHELAETMLISALPLLAIAKGMADTGEISIQDLAQLKSSLCGPGQLKQTLLNRCEVRQFTLHPKKEIDNLKYWFNKALQQANEQQLNAFCRQITGASFLTQEPNKLLIQPFYTDEDLLFVSHTCAHILNVNMNIFNRLFQLQQFDIFTCMLFDTSKIFSAA